MYVQLKNNKYYDWSKEKNKWLIKNRNISFEKVKIAIEKNCLIKIINHSNLKKYSKQKIYLVKIKNYIYAVPYIEDNKKIFLKTIYPSRKYTKKYLKNEKI